MEESEDKKKFMYVTNNIIKDTTLSLVRKDYTDKEIVINTIRRGIITTSNVKAALNQIKEGRIRYIQINGTYRNVNICIVADFVSKFMYLTSERDEYVIPFVDSLAC